jgi:hypothetical protein
MGNKSVVMSDDEPIQIWLIAKLKKLNLGGTSSN